MIDAYTHLDMSVSDPITDFQSKMASAGIDCALAIETWSGLNFPCLERIVKLNIHEFRVAPCFRPEAALPPMDFLRKEAVFGLRVKTADFSRLGNVAGFVESSKKWLVAHAENGIGMLTSELLSLRNQHPQLCVYVPHLGWPRCDGMDDKNWMDSLTTLSRIRGVVVAISAIAHFSREPFPHSDVAPFAFHLLKLFRSESVVVGSDFPMFDTNRYAEYMKLATDWIHRNVEKWSPTLESVCFPKRIPLSR